MPTRPFSRFSQIDELLICKDEKLLRLDSIARTGVKVD
jgi:hypothetical protein